MCPWQEGWRGSYSDAMLMTRLLKSSQLLQNFKWTHQHTAWLSHSAIFFFLTIKIRLHGHLKCHESPFNHLPTYGMTESSTIRTWNKINKTTLTFRGPYIVIRSYNESQRDALFLKFISQTTLHVLDRFSVHHQESSTVYRVFHDFRA